MNTINPILSICIPTRDRVEIIVNTLESIYSSNVDNLLFEVVIYDSSEVSDLQLVIQNKFPYDNLFYKKGKNDGYMNLIHALAMGKGLFLKLHNDYSVFCDSTLKTLIDSINNNKEKQSFLFFSNDSPFNFEYKLCTTFDDFLNTVTYYSSWSTMFGIWKTDFDQVCDIDINPMFPHTSLLFALADEKRDYVIYNKKHFDNQPLSKKGGYNLYETFAVTFLNMVKSCLEKKQITYTTFEHVKRDLLKKFLFYWYIQISVMKNNFSFEMLNIKKNMKVHYTSYDYYYMIIHGYFFGFKNNKWVSKFFRFYNVIKRELLKNKSTIENKTK